MEDLEQYKTMFIVGNGFDLNLGLPTSYNDFMESKEFTKYLAARYENRLFWYLNEQSNINGWIDVENELRMYSNTLINPLEAKYPQAIPDGTLMERRRHFEDEYHLLCDALVQYLDRVTNVDLHTDKPCINLLDTLTESEPLYILNFNYTDVIRRYLTHPMNLQSRNAKYKENHIHGKIDDHTYNNIVFGIQDSAEIAKEHVFLFKSSNQTLDVKELSFMLNNAEKLVFFCYSLGETDHSYFEAFFKQQSQPGCKPKKFEFYCYNMQAYHDLLWQLRVLTGNNYSCFRQYNVDQIKFHFLSK